MPAASSNQADAVAPEKAGAEARDPELTQLRVRVIALENLVIALLAGASDRQLDLARELANYIVPRPGATAHAVTTRAADHMNDLLERTGQFRPAMPAAPYKCTPVFSEVTLPEGLRRQHRTKPGVWGVIRVLDGQLRYRLLDPVSETILKPGVPGLIFPDQPHEVEPIGTLHMQVEFYHERPSL